MLEGEKKSLEYRLEELAEELESKTVSSAEIRTAFKKARQLLKSGELKSTKAIFERYVDKVMVITDKVEIHLNFGFELE